MCWFKINIVIRVHTLNDLNKTQTYQNTYILIKIFDYMLPLPGGVDNANRNANVRVDDFRRVVNHKGATEFDNLTLFWRLSKDEFLNFALFSINNSRR